MVVVMKVVEQWVPAFRLELLPTRDRPCGIDDWR
jgi:hypothetical protein